LTVIETSNYTLNFRYDGSGCLCSQEDTIKGSPARRQRWEIDPAGNRLPVELTDEKQQQQDWAQMVYQNWRYDKQGNRVEQLSLKQDDKGEYPRQRLGYDGANQLTTVEITRVVGRGHVISSSQCRYVYDALGRRLKQYLRILMAKSASPTLAETATGMYTPRIRARGW